MKIDMKKALYCLLELTFLQDSSADVTRLKLNQYVMNAVDARTNDIKEVWVNPADGNILNNMVLGYAHIVKIRRASLC